MAKAAAASTTVTLKQLAAAMSEDHDISRKQAEAMLGDLVSKMTPT